MKNSIMKISILFLFVLLIFNGYAQQRPFIWVKQSERDTILEKIENQAWAHDIYNAFINQLDSEILLHETNPDEYLAGMPFDWEKGEPNKIPPFLLTRHVVNGEYRNLDNATDAEMVPARALIRYLQTGIDCGIAYFLTDDEKYAECALDILYSFTTGVLQSTLSEWRGRGGWLFPEDGFREVREIGGKVPLIYDFIAPYIQKGGKAYDFMKQSKTEISMADLQKVFENYATISVFYGQTGSNHPVLEAPSLVYNALAMDDKDKREEWLSYFLTESTEQQDALPVMTSNYKNEGDIWPESSQYINHVSTILTKLMMIVNQYNPSLRLGEKYSNVLFSLPALDYMVYPNGKIVRWGDGHRNQSPSYKSYEEAWLLGKMDGLEKVTNKFGPLLTKAFNEGKYTRSGIESVLWYNDDFKSEELEFSLPRTDEMPHASLYLQRNLGNTGDPKDGLMSFMAGAPMVHGHASGIDMELYGKGQVLGIDGGRGDYQSDIHENYYRLFAAHNNIIVNGSSQSEGSWVNLGTNPVQLVSMEPMPKEEAVSPDFSFTQASFVDDKGDKAEAVQQRTMSVIRTSPTTGYYFDLFRSKSSLPNEYHDYVYHNFGDKVEFMSEGMELHSEPNRYMANANDPWVQNKQYRHPGWHFFENVETSSIWDKSVNARFYAESLSNPIYMNLFIPGDENREYTRVKAPKDDEAPGPYSKKPLPTILIRKKGEAWERPFLVVYEPSNVDSSSVKSVHLIYARDKVIGAKVRSNLGDKTVDDYILCLPESNGSVTLPEYGISFTGRFAVVRYEQDLDTAITTLYIGDGDDLDYGDLTLKADASRRGMLAKGGKPYFGRQIFFKNIHNNEVVSKGSNLSIEAIVGEEYTEVTLWANDTINLGTKTTVPYIWTGHPVISNMQDDEYTFTLIAKDAQGIIEKKTIRIETPGQKPYPDSDVPHPVPGKIQFEDYDSGGENLGYYDLTAQDPTQYSYRDSDLVDLGRNGTTVSSLETGEWLEYTVDVQQTGYYKLSIRHRTSVAPGVQAFSVVLPSKGDTLLRNCQTLYTGRSTFYVDAIGEIYLKQGKQVIRFSILNPGIELDYMELTLLPTGIKNSELEQSSIKVYPNPASESFTIDLNGITKADVAIYNMAGQLMVQQLADEDKISISKGSEYKSGIYLIRLTTENHKIYHEKLIIK